MASVKITSNAKEYAGWLNNTVAKQIEFAQMVALNRTAGLVKAGELKVMQQRLDRPTPYAMKSLFIDPARIKGARFRSRSSTNTRMEAIVFFKDQTGKGTPATNFMGPQVYGGPRNHKRMERALILKGMMKRSEYAVPGAGVKLDAYGNVPRGTVIKIMSAINAFSEVGYMANRTGSRRSSKKAATADYFVSTTARPGRGIWQRKAFASGVGIRPVFLFAEGSPKYRVRVPFDKIASNIFIARFDAEFDKAFAEAMRTAR